MLTLLKFYFSLILFIFFTLGAGWNSRVEAGEAEVKRAASDPEEEFWNKLPDTCPTT